MTDLDTAHAAMDAAPDDDTKRLQFYERLADTELFMLLGAEAEGDKVIPELFDIEDQKFVLIFDREDRLTQFVGREAPYAGLSGRVLCDMVAGQEIGFALNLEVAPSAMLIPAAAVEWLHQTLGNTPQEAQEKLTEVSVPRGLPEAVVLGLDRKLAIAAGLAQAAYLAAATYDDGGRGHVLAFIDAIDGAQDALAHAAGEALTFSGIEAGTMDVLFAKSSDPLTAHLAKVGLRFDLPALHDPQAPGAPGMDPNKPPRLR
ncbi:MAG: SseB family protein [Yoonia sp.]